MLGWAGSSGEENSLGPVVGRLPSLGSRGKGRRKVGIPKVLGWELQFQKLRSQVSVRLIVSRFIVGNL